MEKILQKFKKYSVYCISTIVFFLSLVLSLSIRTTEILEAIIASPAVISLISLLLKTWVDALAHQRAIELQGKQQDFIFGAASHMANVVYDKHAIFCEEYITRVQKGLQELLHDGPSKNAMYIGRDLVNIRQKHSAWLTNKIEYKLKPFEQTLIKIGAKEGLINNLPVGESRNKVIEEVYKFFSLILKETEAENKEESAISLEQNIENIRDILGVNTFTELRQKIAELTLKRMRGL